MDEQLKQLIEAACKHPKGSVQWRIAMHRLLIKLQKLPGIKKSNHPYYLEALNQTWEWVSGNICIKFVPRSESLEKSLVNWINGYLYWRIKDLYLAKTQKPLSLDAAIGNNEEYISLLENLSATNLKTPTLNGLDGYIENLQQERIQNIALALEDYIQQDPKKRLSCCYPNDYPHCNCQFLAEKRYLQDPADTFRVLAQKLNIPHAKLTNHWYGKCKPLLQKAAKDLGYQPELEQ
ncbi:MAG: hypothetical protein QNJ32_26755 [Xenococcaceae cyanobacterium MO_167.B27]|nr:hypothetical protein [Xenococcaceae cyanobacterium MO_167.B27]